MAQATEALREGKQDGNHPEILVTNRFTRQKLDYLHDNPVAEEIVDEPTCAETASADRPEYYLYSSARDYYWNRQGYLELEFIE